MFGTFCEFSTGPADDYFRPITRDTWREPCFAPVRYNLEKLFGSKENVEELFEFLWTIDETLTTVCDWKLNDALGRKTFYNEMQSLLVEQRIINVKVGALRPEFKIVCDESINSPKVIDENKLLALLSIRREGSVACPVQLMFRFEYVNKG
jgi:hypothetical protein